MEMPPEERLRLYLKFADFLRRERGHSDNYLFTMLFVIFSRRRGASPAEVKGRWSGALDAWDRKGFAALYVNMPYCRSRCLYCVYPSEKAGGEAQIESHVADIGREMQFFAGAFKDVKFGSFYYGGGTPSLPEPHLLERVLEGVASNFSFEEGGDRTMEFDPDSTTFEKLMIAKRWDINRVSLGVQSLDSEVLRMAGRGYQKTWHVMHALSEAKSVGFKMVNADLLLGLWGETDESFLKAFEDVAALQPTSICVYPLQPTKRYAESVGATEEAMNARVKEMGRRLASRLVEAGKKHGYAWPANMPIPREASNWKFRRVEEGTNQYYMGNPDMFCCLGLGRGAISKIGGFRYQWDWENNGAFSPHAQLYTGYEEDARTEMLRYLVCELAKSPVDLSQFRRIFGQELLQVFATEVDALSKLGKMKVEDGKLHLLADTPKEAFSCAMFLLDQRLVEETIKEMMPGGLQ